MLRHQSLISSSAGMRHAYLYSKGEKARAKAKKCSSSRCFPSGERAHLAYQIYAAIVQCDSVLDLQDWRSA